jgi:hypothetical protein
MTPTMKKHFDLWSIAVIVLTLILFAVALVEKGFTHDLLLEAGVFLVSAKLVLMSYKNSVATITLQRRVDEVLEAIRRLEKPGEGEENGVASKGRVAQIAVT